MFVPGYLRTGWTDFYGTIAGRNLMLQRVTTSYLYFRKRIKYFLLTSTRKGVDEVAGNSVSYRM